MRTLIREMMTEAVVSAHKEKPACACA